MVESTSANRVGRTYQPLSIPAGMPAPPVTTRAPSPIPCSMYPRTRSRCRAETSGPMRVSSSNGSPTASPSTMATNASTNSGERRRGTRIRVCATQAWPLFIRPWPEPTGKTDA
jgi:hypothetical protein